MIHTIKFPDGKLQGTISLPTSKSISNRLLIIKALCNNDFQIEGLSDSDDTKLLQSGLQSDAKTIDVQHAGTSMRFLTAYFAATAKAKIITGSESLKNRPIADLVNALNQLGAGIKYLEKVGYAPIRTSGKPLRGDTVEINANVSSQFISAILLIAPTLKNGLKIQLKNKPVSEAYIKMTLQVMQQAGVSAKYKDTVISVAPQKYKTEGFKVERDYTAASYWYQIAALATDCELFLEGLGEKSLQGDAIISQMARTLGIKTEYTEKGTLLKKEEVYCITLGLDFLNTPDLVQTMAVTCCLNNIRFRFAGVATLRKKETDRIAALIIELMKLGYLIEETAHGIFEWRGNRVKPQENITISTYNDHRMAMSFAPAAIKFPELKIQDPDVVSKSYPNFWNDLKSIGVEVWETS